VARSDRPRCGAKTRKSTPCQAPAVWDEQRDKPLNGRYRLHGGLSTGAKTEEGRRRSAQAASEEMKRSRQPTVRASGDSASAAAEFSPRARSDMGASLCALGRHWCRPLLPQPQPRAGGRTACARRMSKAPPSRGPNYHSGRNGDFQTPLALALPWPSPRRRQSASGSCAIGMAPSSRPPTRSRNGLRRAGHEGARGHRPQGPAPRVRRPSHPVRGSSPPRAMRSQRRIRFRLARPRHHGTCDATG
jgi:hypothetical protein